MTDSAPKTRPVWHPPPGGNTSLKYGRESTLIGDLRTAVCVYFDETGRARDGGWRMIFKSAVIVSWTATSYFLLLLWAETWWQFGGLAISLALALAAIGFCIQHDGGHGAYSANRSINRFAAFTLDLMGGSSYMWDHKHNVLHHTYPNVLHADDDITQSPWLRLSESDPLLPAHRHQFWYSWLLYAIIPPKWIFFDDFIRLKSQRAAARRVPPPKGRGLVALFVGKALAMVWIVVVPIAFHGVSIGMFAVYVLIAWVWGAALATTFQLAHCNDAAEFTPWPAVGDPMGHAWAEQQLATTVNFSQDSALVTWYVGGLNYQIEHHLFPRVCHLHYPAISGIVRNVCEAHGVRYRVHGSMIDALRSHIAHLKTVGGHPAA